MQKEWSSPGEVKLFEESWGGILAEMNIVWDLSS